MSSTTQNEFSTLVPEHASGGGDDIGTVNGRPSPAFAETRMPAADEPKQIGRYRIVRVLGQGGMGKVYEAYDVKLERVVALKVMLADVVAMAGAQDRFLREARTMAKVRNDHIVTVYEADEANATPYLAMEFLHGQSLASWIGRGERPRIADVLRIGRETATGLAAAHAKKLIHRDIKPANLWLETLHEGGTEVRVKILDFGLARPVDRDGSITQSGTILGTPYYMSPEQARSQAVDARSDLFSLGVVLYQLCTGKLPFSGKNVTAVLTSLAVDVPPPILDQYPHVPKPLADLIMWLLEKDPSLRPQSAEQVVAALRAIEAKLPEDRGMQQRSGVREVAHIPTLGPNGLANTLPNPKLKPRNSARNWRRAIVFSTAIFGAILGIWTTIFYMAAESAHRHAQGVAHKTPIRLGVLYSKTGRMAVSERQVLDGVNLAVQELNENGGVLGRPIEVVAEDCKSDERVAALTAKKLIAEDHVNALFGCWTSASRKAVASIVEQNDRLLFNPTSFEGLEASPNVIYGGALPNQQVLPALRWTRGFLNTSRWFLIGLDAIHSRGTHAVIRDDLANLGATIVGEELFSVENTGIGDFLARVEAAKPDLFVNTIKGDTNVLLFRGLNAFSATNKIPVLSFAVSEDELSSLTSEQLEGHYASNTYFHSIDSSRNREFLKRVAQRFGPDYIVSDQMQTTYALVHLWALAASKAETDETKAVREALRGLDYDAPQGRVTVDPATQQLVQTIRVGSMGKSGKFEDVYVSPQRIRPDPFPNTRTRSEWDSFTNGLFERWGQRWHNLGDGHDHLR